MDIMWTQNFGNAQGFHAVFRLRYLLKTNIAIAEFYNTINLENLDEFLILKINLIAQPCNYIVH